MKLCLGTVQFGMDYGIHGCKRPAASDSVAMLEYAFEHGIRAIDTAAAYGDAESVVGTFIEKNSSIRNKILLSSKIKPNILNDIPEKEYELAVQTSLERSLEHLHTDFLDICYYHTAPYAFDSVKLEVLAGMKRKGLTRKVGVSVYEPEEAFASMESGLVDILQFPFSIFDRRMLSAGVFQAAKKRKIEIHTRSAFLQGLLMTEKKKIPPFLKDSIPLMDKLQDFCSRHKITPLQLALSFVKAESFGSHLVFGVHSLMQLMEDIAEFSHVRLTSKLLNDAISEIGTANRNIVIPSLWRRRG